MVKQFEGGPFWSKCGSFITSNNLKNLSARSGKGLNSKYS